MSSCNASYGRNQGIYETQPRFLLNTSKTGLGAGVFADGYPGTGVLGEGPGGGWRCRAPGQLLPGFLASILQYLQVVQVVQGKRLACSETPADCSCLVEYQGGGEASGKEQADREHQLCLGLIYVTPAR